MYCTSSFQPFLVTQLLHVLLLVEFDFEPAVSLSLLSSEEDANVRMTQMLLLVSGPGKSIDNNEQIMSAVFNY